MVAFDEYKIIDYKKKIEGVATTEQKHKLLWGWIKDTGGKGLSFGEFGVLLRNIHPELEDKNDA